MLHAEERARTAEELGANLTRTGLTAEEVRARTDLDFAAFDAALHVTDRARPEDVWHLRDRLIALVAATGAHPVPFSVLTETAREQAEGWFPLRS